MKTKIFTTFLLAALTCTSITTQLPTHPATANPANRVYTKANPAVIMIRGTNARGSGFIITPNGYIITNAHVVAGQPKVVTILMADGKTEMPADVVGFGLNGLDLALLKINRPTKFPIVAPGKSKSIRVGDNVYAIGTPIAEKNQNTFTAGIVSSVRDDGRTIQHNVAINQGSSGGPLLNEKGEVIGVNTGGALSNVYCPSGKVCGKSVGNIGVNYAISVDLVKSFIQDVQAGKFSSRSTVAE